MAQHDSGNDVAQHDCGNDREADRAEETRSRVTRTEPDIAIIPDITTDDTDAGWGERRADNDERLLAERPPHWD